MQTFTYFTTGLSLLLTTLASPVELTTRQSTTPNIGLYINDTVADIGYLQTYRVSYANSSIYLGAVKYQGYAEPLVTNSLSSSTDGLSFLSIHSSPTGYQQMYVVPHQSKPLGLSTPHGSAPQGVRTTGWSFAADGGLRNNGLNLFYACQDAYLDSLRSWQIYWIAGPQPAGLTCKGPIKLVAGDACARL